MLYTFIITKYKTEIYHLILFSATFTRPYSYYMERKIFQHLLELKSLQIRSCRSNEAVLVSDLVVIFTRTCVNNSPSYIFPLSVFVSGVQVKRAVDDYHKSVNDLGFEVGGTLNKYQLREYTFKNFELFLYETLKSLQKPGTFNFQNISEVYREVRTRADKQNNIFHSKFKSFPFSASCVEKT